MSTPRFTLGKTTMGQISRKEIVEIQERLKTTPKRSLKDLKGDARMTDPIDATPTHQKREAKYKKCSHCKQYSQTEGKCPACGKGVVR